MISNAAQHTPDWYRARLGNITGSQAGLLMKKGRSSYFSDTAMTYIYQLAAERDMNRTIVEDDSLFEEYLYQTDITSRAMRFGTEQEENARRLYQRLTGRRVVEVGSCAHPTIPHFASSPDGYYYNENTGERGCIEIKCPVQSTFMRYKAEVTCGASLLEVKPEYFYQCQAHMMCTGAQWTDFIVYNPFQAHPIHIVRILPDFEEQRKLEERITEANKIISKIVNSNEQLLRQAQSA